MSDILEKLEQYRLLKEELSDVKKREMELRVELADELSKEGLAAGTHNFNEFDGFKVKLVKKLNYNIDKLVLETLELNEEEAECIRWKPELALKNYKSADDTSNLDQAIIITDGAPTLEVNLV